MKRRLFEYALLLGIVMSVVLLSQTPDVIGHNKSNEEGGPPHKPPGHTHKPSVRVNSITGKPEKGGEDPRGNHYSGICGETKDGYQTAWGMRYYGGKYSPSPGDEDNATQNVFAVRVDAVASTGTNHASIKVTPGIDQLRQYPDTSGNWQGDAEGSASFSAVNYHLTNLWWCDEHSNVGDSWSATGFIDLEVRNEKIKEGEKKEYGGGFESNGAKLTANSEHSYETSYDKLRARGYRFIIELKAGFWSTTHLFQDKDATGWGQLKDRHIISDTATAEYRWTKWKKCYCEKSKSPKLVE